MNHYSNLKMTILSNKIARAIFRANPLRSDNVSEGFSSCVPHSNS